MKKMIFTCLLLAVSTAVVIAQTGTFTEQHNLHCGDTIVIGGLGYPTWNDPHIVQSARVGNSVLIGDFVPPNILVYTAPPYFQGSDTVVIECAHATQITCDTGIYIFNITCDSAAASVVVSEVFCGDSSIYENMSAWWAPYLSAAPLNGTGQVWLGVTDGAWVLYYPDAGFEGTDWLLVESGNGAFEPILFTYHVSCQASNLEEPEAGERLRLWPNPARGILYIEGPELEGNDIEIMDATGRRVLSAQANRNALKLDVGALPQGVYFVGTRNGRALQKLVIR